MPEPEIIPPGRTSKERAQPIGDESLEGLARLLDDVFRIPGTNIRFGIDPLIGLIPGIGDLISGAASFLIIYAGWQRNLPRVTTMRMVANVAIDTVLGSVPVIGDVFDAAWKSNRKNLALLQRESAGTSKKHTAMDTLFLVLIGLVVLGLALLPFVVIWLLIRGL